MSPFIVLRRMATIRETYGVERTGTDRAFKKEREAAATAILALAYTDLYQKQFWIEIVAEEPPDIRLHNVDDSTGHNVDLNSNIEVVDWEEHNEDIAEVIRLKCAKAYPRDYILLVHARRIGGVVDLPRIVEQIKVTQVPFSEIWIIGAIGRDQARIARVAPNAVSIDLNVASAMEGSRGQHPFIKRGIRGSEPGFYSLGATFLPVP